MPTTYIIGHRKPDTDSVISALALEYLYRQLDSFGYPNPKAVIADPVNSETQYLLDRFQVQAPPLLKPDEIKEDDLIVLVDHNELSQQLEGINQDQIAEIIDHHKINLNLNKPIYLNFKAWGCTASIIHFMMKRFANQPVVPTTALAGLMLSAILSDTVGLKSPIVAQKDQEYAQQLAEIAGISDLDQLTMDIFKAKSNTDHLSAAQLVTNDYKLFEFKHPTFIGQLETVEQDKLIAKRKQELLTAMKEVKKLEKVQFLFLAITDILLINTKLLILGKKEQAIAEKAFGGKTQDNVLDIGPMLSRKKQIAPAIEKAVNSA